MEIEWVDCDSSNIVRFGYDAEKGELHVEFRNGGGSYRDVPTDVFDAMKSATSKGSFLAQNVKGIYEWRRA